MLYLVFLLIWSITHVCSEHPFPSSHLHTRQGHLICPWKRCSLCGAPRGPGVPTVACRLGPDVDCFSGPRVGSGVSFPVTVLETRLGPAPRGAAPSNHCLMAQFPGASPRPWDLVDTGSFAELSLRDSVGKGKRKELKR